jgi:protein tyrosine/serine phosphatase
MKRVIPIALLLTAALLPAAHAFADANCNGIQPSAACQLPTGARTSEHIYGNLPGLSNVGRVAPGLYRGAQPEADGYATLKKMGIRTVINLRTSMSERKEVEAAGMRSIEVPMEMSRDGLKAKVDKVVALMADPANRPLFVHCRQGHDRTGIIVAAYRMKVEGWSLPEAEAEMEAFGFNDVWVNFRRFIRGYGEQLPKK